MRRMIFINVRNRFWPISGYQKIGPELDKR